VPGECLVNNVSQEVLRLLTRAKGNTDQDFCERLLNPCRREIAGSSLSLPGIVGFNGVFHLTPDGSHMRGTVLLQIDDDKVHISFENAPEQYRAAPCQ